MQTISPENKVIVLMHDAKSIDYHLYNSILEAFAACFVPWSSALSLAVLRSWCLTFNPDRNDFNSTHNQNYDSRVPFYLLRDLSLIMAPANYINLLNACEAHMLAVYQQVNNREVDGFPLGMHKNMTLITISRVIDKLNRQKVTVYTANSVIPEIIFFSTYKRRLRENNIRKIEILLRTGQPLEGIYFEGFTALEYAVDNNKFRLTQEILKKVRPGTSEIKNAYELALAKGNNKVVQLLKKAEAPSSVR